MADLTAEERDTLTNRLQRFLNRIGPKIRWSRYWPVAEVHNVESWNTAHPEMAATRHC